MTMSWCGNDSDDGRLITSCGLYTCILWVPHMAFLVACIPRFKISSRYLHFALLDNKTGMILFLFQILSGLQLLLSLTMFFGSDETSLILLICSILQSLAWLFCAILTTRECWRLTTWPGEPTQWYLYGTTVTNILQVLTANNDAVVYSDNLVKCGTGLAVVSSLMAVMVVFKDHVYSEAEKERLELDRVSVDVMDGHFSHMESSFSGGGVSGGLGAGGGGSVNPIFGKGSLIGRLLGRSDSKPQKRGSSGVSLLGWFSDVGEDVNADYAVVDGADDEWRPGQYQDDYEARSNVMSALERHNLVNEYQPPDGDGGGNSNKRDVLTSYPQDDENEWHTISAASESGPIKMKIPDNHNFLHDGNSPGPNQSASGSSSSSKSGSFNGGTGVGSFGTSPSSSFFGTSPGKSPISQSQAVQRALMQKHAKSSSSTFGAVPPSRKNGGAATASASSAWVLRQDKGTVKASNGNQSNSTDYYTIAVTKWGLRHPAEGEDAAEEAEAAGETSSLDEIEFEVVITVLRSKEGSSRKMVGDWSGFGGVSSSETAAGGGGSVGESGGKGGGSAAEDKWSVWRTGAEVMSLHSQLVIAHGESAAPRRPKLKSTQPKAGENTVSQIRGSRSVSTDRASYNSTPPPFLQGLKVSEGEGEAAGVTNVGSIGSDIDQLQQHGVAGKGGVLASPADIATDMRTLTVYLTALLAISNKSFNGLSTSPLGSGCSGGVGIPTGGLGNIYPGLLIFLNIYVGGDSVSKSVVWNSEACTTAAAAADDKHSRRNSFGSDSGNSPRPNVYDSSNSSAYPSTEDAADTIYDDENDKENWRKLFLKLKSHVVPQDQCIRTRLFPGTVRASDVHNYLQVSNQGFLKEEEALNMGQKLLQCGLLRAVVVGHHGPSAMQVLAEQKNKPEPSAEQRGTYITNVWAEGPADGDRGGHLKVPTEGPGSAEATPAQLHANSAFYLYEYENQLSSRASTTTAPPQVQLPIEAFSLLGGSDIEVSITKVENSDSSVRYCLSLKHIAPQVGTIDRKYNSSGSDRWTVWRRYSDFDKFNNELHAVYVIPPVSLPPKTWVASSDPNARRDGLAAYIKSAIDTVMKYDEEKDTRESLSENRLSVLNPLELINSYNVTNKAAGMETAKVLLARFLDNDHDELTIRGGVNLF